MSDVRVCVLHEFPEGRNKSSKKRIWVVKVSPGYKNLMMTEDTEEECGFGTSDRLLFT